MREISTETQDEDVFLAGRIQKVATGQATIAEAVGISKKQLYAIAEKGYLLFSQGRLEDAKKIYEGLVAADPFDSVFHCHLGAVMWRSGDTDRAFEEYDAAVRYNIANIDALAGRGELLIARGEVEKGAEDLSRALEYDPDCTRPSTQRARALLLTMREAAKAKRRA
jgi:tetratricopeptide (TPR) repeat protein